MRTPLLTLALAATLALSACSSEEQMRAVDPAGEASGSETLGPDPSEAPVPVPGGTVRTPGLVTVLDEGDGPVMCLGPIAESAPPQCGGPALADFDWGQVGAQEAAGVTWGSYALTGTWDGTTFTVSDAIPAALYDVGPAPTEEPLAAACDAPSTTDAAKATPEDLDATLAAASALPGYASSWLSGETINVAVTQDEAGAEQTLRRTWGGPLCVTTVEDTEVDLTTVDQELQVALGDQLLTSGSYAPDSLEAEVVYDDGAIQDWADATWGAGLVRVSSALLPVS